MSHPLPTSMQYGGVGQPSLDNFAKTLAELRRLTDFVNADLDADLTTREALTAAEERLDEFDVQAAGMRRGLRIIQSPTSPQTDFTIKMERFALSDGETVLKDISVLIDVGDVGAGGIDVGPVITANRFHYAHICHDPTHAMSPDTVGVISLSPTPVLPAGYTLSGLVDPVPFVLTDADGELVAFSHIPHQDTIMYYSKEAAGVSASVALTTGDTWHTGDLSSIVPAGACGAWIMFRGDWSGVAPGTYFVHVRPNWGSLGDGETIQRQLFEATVSDSYYGPFWIPLDEDGVFQYRPGDAGAAAPTLLAWMVGIQLGSKE